MGAMNELINSSAAVLTNAGGNMTQPCVLKILLFSLFLFFYQQGLANDTYGLEEFLKPQKESGEPPLKKQKRTDQPDMSPQPTISPLENIRIGFVRLNLESDDLSGDDRLETCEDYQVAEQDFNRLDRFYFNYVGMGDPQNRKVRIQRMLRLFHSIFTINTSMTLRQSQEGKELIKETAKILFDQLFFSNNINGRSNPYYDYFYLMPELHQTNSVGLNNGLVLTFIAFLGPHCKSEEILHTYISMLHNLYTGQSYDQAFDSALLSENINEYSSPQSLANQLNLAKLDAETALVIGLTVMASGALEWINKEHEPRDTLEVLLIRFLPVELLVTVYSNIASHCRHGRSYRVPGMMYGLAAMQKFTQGIVGIYPTGASLDAANAELRAENAELRAALMAHNERSDNVDSESEATVEESDSEDQDPSIVIQQQNELIAQLRQELANQTATEEGGAVGGATGVTKTCGVCRDPLQEMMLFENCVHVGMCQNCIERSVEEEGCCPYCRIESSSYKKLIDVSR
ncbi:RING finger protein [Endozoicomonas sp. 4G]|uniref:RING finger protein n=1 Tax=Endozoicomonas sp. 4G TaxID=2872754 RepID=UPI00207852D3|nr:RING finger protein [Endozoicomonas sp. 4G]